MLQDISINVCKHFINNYSLSIIQIDILKNTIDNYKQIALKTSNSYAAKMMR